MKAKRILCLLLVLVLSLAVLASCKPDQGSNDDGGGKKGDDWSGVNFNGAEVRMAVSVNKDDECTFPAADIYTSCENKAASSGDSVQKKARSRNSKVATTLNINMKYISKDLKYNEILDDIQKMVASDPSDSVDIYNNDMYGLLRAAYSNFLWNAKNPGEEVKQNYFDFSHSGWYSEFMNGCTLDPEKIYVFSGDYFIDMVRMAWVLYVNADMFNSNAKTLGYDNVDEFYEYVSSGQWDYDTLATMARVVHRDTANRGQTDEADEQLGLAINHVSGWIFRSSTGNADYIYQDKDLSAKVRSADEIQPIYNMNAKFSNLYNTLGVFYKQPVLDSTKIFMENKVLFAVSVLGELESDEFRNVDITKGLVPIPKYDMYAQENYHTMVHDQTEVGCILNNASNFSAASAAMQMLNEESASVLNEYYEGALKFKYNPAGGSGSEGGVRTMIDLVHDTIDSPFGMQMTSIITNAYGSNGNNTLKALDMAADAKSGTNSVRSVYEANLEIYKTAVKEAMAKFAALK